MSELMKQFIDVQENSKGAYAAYESSVAELSPLLAQGIEFTRINKAGQPQLFRVKYINPQSATVDQIVATAQQIPQLAHLDREGILTLANRQESLIAEAQIEGGEWEFAAYLGAEVMDDMQMEERLKGKGEGVAVREMRTSITLKKYGGLGLNQILKIIQMANLFARSHGLLPVAFTDDIPACEKCHLPSIRSESMGINRRLGMQSIPVSATVGELKSSLVEPCPDGRCALRGDAFEGQEICGCQLWYFDPSKGIPATGIQVIDNIFTTHGILGGGDKDAN